MHLFTLVDSCMHAQLVAGISNIYIYVHVKKKEKKKIAAAASSMVLGVGDKGHQAEHPCMGIPSKLDKASCAGFQTAVASQSAYTALCEQNRIGLAG